MSRENVEIVRRGFEAWVHGDMHEVGAMLAPDVRWEGVRDNDKACRGSEEVLRFVRLGRKKGPKLEVEELLDGGQVVVVGLRREIRSAGEPFEGPERTYNLVTLRDRKVVAMKGYWQRSEALEAAGLSE